MSPLENWYRRRSIDIADAKTRRDRQAWESLGAAARMDNREHISDVDGTDVLTGSDSRDQMRQASSGKPKQRIDPSKTEVFRKGPDGKLHPIEGWHTTGPFAFSEWAHNIDWGGVVQDLMTIASRSIVGAGLPGLRSRRNIIGPHGEGLTPTDKLTLGSGVYVAGDGALREVAPRQNPKNQ